MINTLDNNIPIANVSDAIGAICLYEEIRTKTDPSVGITEDLVLASSYTRALEAIYFLHQLEQEHHEMQQKLIKLLMVDQAVI